MHTYNTYVCIYVYLCVYIHVYTHTYAHLNVCICMCEHWRSLSSVEKVWPWLACESSDVPEGAVLNVTIRD